MAQSQAQIGAQMESVDFPHFPTLPSAQEIEGIAKQVALYSGTILLAILLILLGVWWLIQA